MSVEIDAPAPPMDVPQPAPAAPSGGLTSDVEARTVISALITALKDAGVLV